MVKMTASLFMGDEYMLYAHKLPLWEKNNLSGAPPNGWKKFKNNHQ